MNEQEIATAVKQIRWYHEIDVCEGVRTLPESRYSELWALIEHGMESITLTDKRVLDVGTRDGKWAFQAEKNGAIVVGIDNDPSPGAAFLKDYFKSTVEFRTQSLYDIKGEKFDVIFFFGVLYHLRYPMLGLKVMSELLPIGGMLYIESGMMDAHENTPMLYCPVRESPYEITSCTFFNLAGLTETLWSLGLTVKSHRMNPNENGQFVRRMWIEAEKTHDTPEGLSAYWNGFHKSHN